MSTQKTLKINPELFKMNGKFKKDKSKKNKPIIDKTQSESVNKVKRELLKKVKDYQKNKEIDKIKQEKNNLESNLFEKNDFENTNFEREFNNSLNFLQNLAKKNKEKKKKKQHTLKNLPNIEVNLNLPNELNKNIDSNEPKYGCLKNGSKPTYHQLNKTQKNNETKPRIKIVLENNVYDNGPKIHDNISDFNEIIDEKINNVSMNIKTENIENQKNLENKVEILPEVQILPEVEKKVEIEDNLENNILNANSGDIDNKEILKVKNLPKINKITRTYKYKLGKKKGDKHIGILMKNRETQKKIKDEISIVKQKSIQEIKNYLRKKNLIKVGTDSPNDVIRKLYEDSMLAGDVTNNNNSNLLYNYMNE